MHPFCFIALLLLTAGLLSTPASTSQHSFAGAALHGRSARYLLVIGGELLRTINGDKRVKHVYLKYGGGTRAREDFYSVQPRNVRIENMGQLHIGEVGNRNIVLELQGSVGKPTLTITNHDKGGTIVDEIRYHKKEQPEIIEPLFPPF